MRPDMDRVIIDTYRLGGCIRGRNPNSREANLDFEELPNKESMTLKWKKNYSGKEQGDRLSPLRRWLDKQVGKKWNDVYSELCHLFDKRSVSQSHLLDHLQWMIEKNVEYIDGLPYLKAVHRWGWQRPISEKDLYVCPDTGIIKRGVKDKEPRKIKLEEVEHIDFKNNRSIEKIKGIWYEVFTTKVKRYYDYPSYRYFYETETRKKRQLNTKEIRILNKYIEDCLKLINDSRKSGKGWDRIRRRSESGGISFTACNELNF